MMLDEGRSGSVRCIEVIADQIPEVLPEYEYEGTSQLLGHAHDILRSRLNSVIRQNSRKTDKGKLDCGSDSDLSACDDSSLPGLLVLLASFPERLSEQRAARHETAVIVHTRSVQTLHRRKTTIHRIMYSALPSQN